MFILMWVLFELFFCFFVLSFISIASFLGGAFGGLLSAGYNTGFVEYSIIAANKVVIESIREKSYFLLVDGKDW